MRKILCGLTALTLGSSAAIAQTSPPVRADTASSPVVDTAYVDYHDSPLTLPLGLGFRMPGYDRVDGLSLPWGPRLELGEWLRADALATYRSHLGDFDPTLDVRFMSKKGHELTMFASRGTLTNDDWIRGNVANTLASFGVGSDARNYFRGDRAEVKLKPSLRMGAFTVTPMVGGRFESDWGTSSLRPTSTPWSIFGRSDSLKMKRPNPPILRGHIASALGGIGFSIDETAIAAKIAATVEHATKSPVGTICTSPYTTSPLHCLDRSPSSFTQTTVEGSATFPTFASQTFTARLHAIVSSSPNGLLPQQRYGYLGGAGTLATVELLTMGGDRLFFAQADYNIPVSIVTLPFLGSPYVDLHYATGSAGVGAFPTFIQNIGIGVGISYFRADYTIDPASNRSPFSKKSDLSIGVSLSK
jgi:hypothetical protein